MLVHHLLSLGLLHIYPQVVERLGGELDHLGLWHNVKAKLLINQAGSCLRHVALVWNQAGPERNDQLSPFHV